ncbi:MAG TPA: hypothetical protein VI391_03895 [Thermoanaerobaculia bacterium]
MLKRADNALLRAQELAAIYARLRQDILLQNALPFAQKLHAIVGAGQPPPRTLSDLKALARVAEDFLTLQES